MFHTSAFIDPLFGSPANSQVPVVVDNILTTRNGNLFPAMSFRLLYAFAGCGDITTSRLTTPTWRVISPVQIQPVNLSDQPGDNASVADYRSMPLLIPGGQELGAEGSSVAGLTPGVVVIGITERPTIMPAGQIFTIIATSVSVATVNTWSNMALTFADNLPPGRYAIVGANAQSATGMAFRLNIPGQLLRPGGLCMTLTGDAPPKFQMKGGLGNWGEFNNDTMPLVELLATGADAAMTLFLDIIKIG